MNHASAFLDHCLNSRGLSPATAENYSDAIADLEKTLGVDDPAKITTADLDVYMTRKALGGAAASTRRSRGHALKAFFRFLAARGFIEKDPGAEFRPPEEKGQGISTFTVEEVQRLIFFRKPEAVRAYGEAARFFERRARVERLCGLRDSALLGLSYVCGLRSGEIAGLRNDSLVYDNKGRCSIRLFGKRAREPKLFMVDVRVAALVSEYLTERAAQGIEHPALFCPIGARSSRAHETDQGITSERVCVILRKRLSDAGLKTKGRKITPHIWRYTRATHLFEANMPIAEISSFLRHASIETTLRYIRLASPASVQKRAIAKLPWNTHR